MTVAALLLLSVGASFVQRVSGFGFGIFIMTALPYLMPSYGEATCLSGLLALTTSTMIVIRYHRHLNWRHLLPILTTFIIVSFFAIMIVGRLNDGVLRKILGAALIVISLYLIFINGKLTLPATLSVQCSMGTLSGIMGGLFGMQGPPAVLYFLAAEKTKEEYIALAQTYFLVGNMCMTVFRAHTGFLTPFVGIGCCAGLPGVLLGTWIGGKVFARISVSLLRKIVYLYMGVSGILALVL